MTTLKMHRESLCQAQMAIYQLVEDGTFDVDQPHIARLQELIGLIDLLRPLGPDGKHGDRHTPLCGCEDKPVAAP